MSVRKSIIIASLVLIGSVAAPRKASADWLFTPFVGWNWGGSANFVNLTGFDDKFEQRVDFGASFGWMGAGIIGWEVDLGFSPNFFQNTAGSSNFGFGDSNVTTVMGNVVIGAPIGGQHGVGFRPYASGGVGLIKSRIGDAGDLFHLDSNDFGFDVGAGAMFFFSDHFGVRGDLRYFRSLQDNNPDNDIDLGLSGFHFWRTSAGATFRW
jgi:opacity protein-like surface antigen